MRIEILKNVRPNYISILKEILLYEDKKGTLNYYSKISNNGIAWKIEDVSSELTQYAVNYLLKKGILERLKPGIYRIAPKIKEQLRRELDTYSSDIKSNINIENALRYAIHGDADARAILNILNFHRNWRRMYDDVGWDLSRIKEIIISTGADMSLLGRLRESGLVVQLAENEFSLVEFEERLLDPYLESTFSTQDAVWEYMNIVIPMRRQFDLYISHIGDEDIDELRKVIRDVDDVVSYTKHLVNSLYLDILLPIIQQYGMVDLPIYSSEGRKITQTGFSLAYFGEPGTGKTFATDDFIRGNTRLGIPPHGVVGRVRYAEGMTPKKLISILEAYQNYPIDWIVPEFNDFFRYKGMVEKLKLVMEQREVSDETKKEVINPYKVTSFFIVNYNTKVSRGKWSTTIEDPNFNAVEDRMICKIFVNDEDREREIYENMVRRISGDIEWYLSEHLRRHLTYSYHLLKNGNFRLVLNTSDFVTFGNKIRELRKRMGVRISNRIILKGVQIAGSAALVKAMNIGKKEIPIAEPELSLALNFIEEEIETRSMKY